MPRLARSKQYSRTGSLTARKRRSRPSRVRHLANPASLTGIPKLNSHHSGTRITLQPEQLAELLAATRPEMKVLYISGYPRDELVARGQIQPHAHLLQKPFGRAVLETRVRELLSLTLE